MSVITYDPEGDVIINCWSAGPFRVSSKALSIVSPVFRAMFKPGFKEGLAVSNDQCPVVDLPQDHPNVFEIFCNIAYHKSDSLPQAPEPEFLQQIAVFIDKYLCREAFLDRGRIWLQQSLRGQCAEDLWKILQFAYVLNLQKEFSDITRELLFIKPTSFRGWEFVVENLGLLPECILDIFDVSRERFTQKMQYALIHLLEEMNAIPTFSFSCDKYRVFIGSYMENLRIHGILPGMVEARDKSFVQTCADAAKMSPSTYEWYKGADYRTIEVKRHLISQLHKCADEEEGICLACLNPGDCEKHRK